MTMSQQRSHHGKLSALVNQHETEILSDWVREQASVKGRSGAALKNGELREQCTEFLALLRATMEKAKDTDIESPEWKGIRGMLDQLSRSRVTQGFSPSETASFIFSLKRPLFASLRR